MKWIEIINVRALEISKRELLADMLKGLGKNKDPIMPEKVKLYYHAAVESDVSVHICWNYKKMPFRKSPLGFKIAEEAGSLGLVNHSVWVEDIVALPLRREE